MSDRNHVWVVYHWGDSGPEPITIHALAEDAVFGLKQAGYGKIACWFLETDWRESIKKWEEVNDGKEEGQEQEADGQGPDGGSSEDGRDARRQDPFRSGS